MNFKQKLLRSIVCPKFLYSFYFNVSDGNFALQSSVVLGVKKKKKKKIKKVHRMNDTYECTQYAKNVENIRISATFNRRRRFLLRCHIFFFQLQFKMQSSWKYELCMNIHTQTSDKISDNLRSCSNVCTLFMYVDRRLEKSGTSPTYSIRHMYDVFYMLYRSVANRSFFFSHPRQSIDKQTSNYHKTTPESL